MPRCEGMPDGRCPEQRNDSTVKNGEGDLMLCPKCDSERHRMWLAAQGNSKVVTGISTCVPTVVDDCDDKEKYELRGGGASTNISEVSTRSASVKLSRGNNVSSHAADMSVASVDVHDDANQDGICAGAAYAGPYTDNGVNKLYRTVEVNELLCFLSNMLHNHPVSIIKKATLEFYREDEILAAKQLLLQVITDKSLPIQQYRLHAIELVVLTRTSLLLMTL